MKLLQNEMVNQDTVSKQEEQLKLLKNDIHSTNDDLHAEEVLNLQLSNENNTLITKLSHILTERNQLLLECESLRNTMVITQQQLEEGIQITTAEQSECDELHQHLQEIEERYTDWKKTVDQLDGAIEQCTAHGLVLPSVAVDAAQPWRLGGTAVASFPQQGGALVALR